MPGGDRLSAAPLRAGRARLRPSTAGRSSRWSTRWATSMPGESQAGPVRRRVAGSDTIIQGLRAGARGRRRCGRSSCASTARAARARRRTRSGARCSSRGGRSRSSCRWATTPPRAATTWRWARTRSWPSPGTITGSIGVFSGKFSLRGLYEKLGISQETVSRGTNADALLELRALDATRSARRCASMNLAFYDDLRQQGGRGAQEDAGTRSTRWPRAGCGPASRRSGAASWTRSAASTSRCASRASAPASRRARTCSSWSCPSEQGLLRDADGAPGGGRERPRALGRGAAVARALGDGAVGPRPDRARCPSSSGPLSGRASCRSAGAGARPACRCRLREVAAVDAAEGLVRAAASRPWPAAGR